MNRFTFLPNYIFYPLFIVLVFALWYLSIGQTFFVLLIVGFVFYISRRPRVGFTDTLKPNGEIYLSPVFGTVKSVRQNIILEDHSQGHEVRIAMDWKDPKGLYLPTNGEVSYLKAIKGRKIPRNADALAFYGSLDEVAHTNMTLDSKNNTKTMMRFIDAPYGQRPTIWLKSGDRGRGAACFGYYPFGGTLLIQLPKNSDILVFESERVIPGQTVIAAIKD